MASEIKVDTVSEKTSGSGVTIDGVLLKDGGISGDITIGGTTPTLTIGDAGAEDAKIVFDGNAQDFHIGLDDSADDLVIGVGSALGTTPAIQIADNLSVTVGKSLIVSKVANIPFYNDNAGSIYTHDVSGTDDNANNNTAYGINALDAITTGDSNVSVGYVSGTALTTASFCTLIGVQAGTSITTGADNIAIGYGAMDGFDTETHNLGIGRSALGGAVAGGEYNIAIGNSSLDELTSGDSNTAVGYNAGHSVTTGYNNTFIGLAAGGETTTGATNTFIGFEAGNSTTTGQRNTAVGTNAYDDAATTEGDNTAVGYFALASNAINGAEFNTAVGSYAGDAISGADSCTLVGYTAGSQITTGNKSTCVGSGAGTAITTADNNVTVGDSAGAVITTGENNTFVGTYAGNRLVDGTGNICIGYDADTSASDQSNAIAIGYNIQAAGNDFSFGKASNVVTCDFDADADWARSSDLRLKRNIQDTTLGLDFINDLRPIKFQWKPSNEVPKEMKSEYNEVNQKNLDITSHGFIAQEVKEAIDKHGDTTFGGWHLDKADKETQRVKKNMFVMPLIKAVQELSAQVRTLQNEINTLKGE
jgi:hypothetical protein